MPSRIRFTTAGGTDLELRELTNDERAARPCDLCAIRRAELALTAPGPANAAFKDLEPLYLCGNELAKRLLERLIRQARAE